MSVQREISMRRGGLIMFLKCGNLIVNGVSCYWSGD